MTNDINELAERIHQISTSKGFTPPDLINLPEKLMLAVSELAEALEEHRSGKPLVYFKYTGPVIDGMTWTSGGAEYQGRAVDHQGLLDLGLAAKPEGILVELGDAAIRIFHMMHSLIDQANLNPDGPFPHTVSDVLNLKVNFNEGRPAMHGRAY